MGSLVQAIREAAGVDNAKEIKERLELLLVAAKAKIRGYRDEINENFMNPAAVEKIQVPGIRAIRFIEQYHVASKSSFNTQVADHMSHAIDAFFSIGGKDTDTKDAVKNGIQSLISGALDGFIGSTEAGETEQKIYIVVPENNAFIRADICLWKYHMSDSSIASNSDTAVAYVLCKSVIDHNKLTIDELIYMASDALATRKPMVVPRPLNDTEKALKTAITTKRTELATVKAKTPEAGKEQEHTDAVTAAEHAVTAAITAFNDAVPDEFTLADASGIPIRTPGGDYVSSKTIDLANPMAANPPAMTQVEAYIEEMIRVWKKLKEERGI